MLKKILMASIKQWHCLFIPQCQNKIAYQQVVTTQKLSYHNLNNKILAQLTEQNRTE